MNDSRASDIQGPTLLPPPVSPVEARRGGLRLRAGKPSPCTPLANRGSWTACVLHAALVRILFLLFACLFLPGCVDQFGTGGTGETVVPDFRLHDVNPAGFQREGVARSADEQPTTGPSTPLPPPELILSIADCRAAALQNNLDLKVSLFDPTIAHTALTAQEAAFEAIFNGSSNFGQTRSAPAGNVPSFTQYSVNPDANLLVPLRTGG